LFQIKTGYYELVDYQFIIPSCALMNANAQNFSSDGG